MSMILKTIVALCLGVGALTAAQHLWMSSIMGQVRSQMASGSSVLPQSQFKPAFTNVDADKLRTAILPTVAPIDTKRFEALGVQSAQRRIDMQIRNAQSYVPVTGRTPGLRH
jgi:hypothetical protein